MIDPGNAELHDHLGLLLRAQGKIDDVIAQYQESLRLQPDQAEVLKNLAWICATHSDPRFRDGAGPWPMPAAPSNCQEAKCTVSMCWPPPTRRPDIFRKPWPRPARHWNWPGSETIMP